MRGDLGGPRRRVTGGNIEPGKGRLDFAFDALSAARVIVVDFVGREMADAYPALIRVAAHLIPREIDPLRVIDIVGLHTDRPVCGSTMSRGFP